MNDILSFYGRFGVSSINSYAYFPYSCNGSEETLSSCTPLSGELNCSNDPLSALAIDCHSKSRNIDKDNLRVSELTIHIIIIICHRYTIHCFIQDLTSNLMVIIMCNIVIGLLIVVVPTDIMIIIYFIQKRSSQKPPDPTLPWSFI